MTTPTPPVEQKESKRIVDTAYEYLYHDLKLPKWKALLIAGKIGITADLVLTQARADERKKVIQEILDHISLTKPDKGENGCHCCGIKYGVGRSPNKEEEV